MIRILLFFMLLFSSINTQAQGKIHARISKERITAFPLDKRIQESSGLIYWNNFLWTHNDDTDLSLYAIDPKLGVTDHKLTFKDIQIIDWEEIQHDASFLYLGDFGNNFKGNRTNLRIYKYNKKSGTSKIIQFTYPHQKDFSAHKPNSTNFDCEAFLVSDSMLYLFTKEWKKGNTTTVYKIPNKEGNYTAIKIGSFSTPGLISGAAFNADHSKIILTAYSKTLSPALFLLENFKGDQFQNASKKTIKLKETFMQVEAITFIDSNTIAISCEAFSHAFIKSEPQLYLIDIKDLFSHKKK